MNGRVLRIELRRSVAPWAGAVSLCVALAFLYLASGPWWKGVALWTSQWTSMALWTRFLLAVLWPLALALGALQGLRDHRSRMAELLTSTPRPARHRAATTAGATAITVTSAFALVVLLGAVQVAGAAEYTHLGWLPISLVGMLALVAAALLGMGIGRNLPSPLTPPALAVAAFVFVNLLRLSTESAVPTASWGPSGVTLLSPAVDEVRDVFVTLSTPVHLGQTVWLLGMAVTGFALLVAATPRARLLALAPVLAGAVVALLVLPADPRRVYVVDEAAAAQVCDGPVCVAAAHQDRLAALAGPGKKALRLMKGALGGEAPTSVRESTARRGIFDPPERSRTAVLVDFGDDVFGDTEGEQLTRALLGQGITPNCFARSAGESGTVGELAAQGVVAGWVLGDLRPFTGTVHTPADQLATARPVFTELKALPWSEQVDRVMDAHTAAVSCSGDPLDILDGGTAR